MEAQDPSGAEAPTYGTRERAAGETPATGTVALFEHRYGTLAAASGSVQQTGGASEPCPSGTRPASLPHVDLLTDPAQFLAILGAAIFAGAGNAIAGGGTILSFPVLVWAGLPPVLANTTNTVGLWAGLGGGAWSYRRRITSQGGWTRLWIPTLSGGALGAGLLLALPPDWFGAIAPWLMISCAVLVAADPMMRRRFPEGAPRQTRLLSSAGALFLVSVYGGYFGAGIGILILLTLGRLGMEDLHDANGIKNLLVVGIKGVAMVLFAVTGMVVWVVALVMLVGSSAGGWAAGYLVQKLDQATLRWVVVGVGLSMGVLMLVRG